MKISSIIDIVDGEKLNSPSISYIYSIKTEAKKIKQGDLFIAKNIEDIPKAIENGAFAILIDTNTSILDFEIAWIKVNNLQEALIKLIRFKLSHFDLNVFYCDTITFNYIQILKNSLNTQIKMIENCLDNFLLILEDIENENILIFEDKELMDKLYPKNQDIKVSKFKYENLVEHTIFESSFTYKELFFSKIRVPSLYINEFLTAYYFLEEEKELIKLKNSTLLKPIFVDRFLNQVEIGKSNKFILIQNNSTLLEKEITYLKKKYKYGKTIFITSKYINNFFAKQNIIEDINKLKEFLIQSEFNAAYIIGYTNEEILNILDTKQTQLTLL